MTGKALAEALDRCEALLSAERAGEISEAAVAQKEAAIAHVESLLGSLPGMSEEDVELLVPRLQALMASNRYSLKWNGMRAQLAQIGQPKPAAVAPPNRPRVDLVH